jgi:hypothetical protein
MANEIERRYGASGLHGLSLHPGWIQTGLAVFVDSSLVESLTNNVEMRKYEKSTEQGAATQVYAAVSKDLEGKGAKWLSNCNVWGPGPGTMGVDDGYADYAFDSDGEKQLWKDSLNFVGLKDDA